MDEGGQWQVLLYYLYRQIDEPGELMIRQRVLCEELELRGRILVGNEGINGTVSGTTQGTRAYMKAMDEDPLTAGMTFKVDPCDGHVFPKLSVIARSEVVTLGLVDGEDIDPNEVTGIRLSPKEFAEAMADPDAVLLDGRNDYESALGHFRGAICPAIPNFRDFPEWIRRNRHQLEGKKVLTYCTGGIRCEKLSGFLLGEGFSKVFQLEGGIINYSHDEATAGRDFEGLCYVFDERVGVDVNRTEGRTVISECRHCGELCPRYRNCAWKPCNAQFFCCEACEERVGRYHSDVCLEVARNQEVIG